VSIPQRKSTTTLFELNSSKVTKIAKKFNTCLEGAIKMGEKKVVLYTKVHCPLCDEAHKLLKELQSEIPFQIESVDIYQNDDLIEKYGLMIPVIEVEEKEIDFGKISKEKVKKALTNF
jgi:thiol-disulfide isomerase/thioredoxin